MHPASSVIAFTTASGAGYGLLSLLGVFMACGVFTPDRGLGFAALSVALGLITAGLLSSTIHLGRPERAWRALSQWRSSWLSREGVASVATYAPAALFGVLWVIFGRTDGLTSAAGLAAAAGALVTVFTTGMIYASLKPVAQWHSPYTVPAYLIFALMTGATLLSLLLGLFGLEDRAAASVACATTLFGWVWKIAVWRHNDALRPAATLNSATGLKGGPIRSLEWPHTEENYLLKEMGFQVARKHAARLRRFVHLMAFAVPLATLVTGLLAGGGAIGVAGALVAALAQSCGVVVERWLFFAEAKHVVTLYYGR